MRLQVGDDRLLVEPPHGEVLLVAADSNGLNIRLCSGGRPGAISLYRDAATCDRFMPVISALPDVRLLQRRVTLGPNSKSMCSYVYPTLPVHDELAVLHEVGDLELRLRLHDLALVRLQRLEASVRVEDVAEDDPVELHRRRNRRLEARVLLDRDRLTLLPAVEQPRAARDRDRVQEHVVHVLARDDVRRDTGRSRRATPRRRTSFLKVTVTVLPLPPPTLLMSSQPVRLITLNVGLVNTFHVARKSAAVTSLPSLHSASGLYVKLDGERALLDELRLAGAEARHPRRRVVPDLAAIPDVVRTRPSHTGCCRPTDPGGWAAPGRE